MLRDVLKNLSNDIGKISELALAAILLPAVAAKSTFLEIWEHYAELLAGYASADGDDEPPAP